MLHLKFGLSFDDLYSQRGLQVLDAAFLTALQEGDPALQRQLSQARAQPEILIKGAESTLIFQLAPFLEDFLGFLFGIEADLVQLQEKHHHLAPLYRCKRLFVQRQALKAYSPQETQTWAEKDLLTSLEDCLEGSFSELFFAQKVLAWMGEGKAFQKPLEVAKRYSAWRCHHRFEGSILFQGPQKKDFSAQLNARLHQGFTVWEKPLKRAPTPTREKALDQSHYCILCHNQGKDSCSIGFLDKNNPAHFQKNALNIELIGCPLEQKISEMNTLRNQGTALGALATLMIDNPLVAATGHRICNECSTGCIFQKQDPVDIPTIETQTLQEILDLPWGFEIYSLLSRWNPLNFRHPLPRAPSGYKVLVAGMGPAGFTLAHYLMNAGHSVVGIDGLKIEPLPPSWNGQTPLGERTPFLPIQRTQDLFSKPGQRIPQGFGGVAEYGITSRWDKNYLTLIRLLLERREAFLLLGSTRLGSTLSVDQAFEKGFDHVALCLGAGRPKIPPLKNILARGVRTASDFLMTLQLNRDANLQVRLPIAVIGGGLTALDTATEALVYYPLQVEQFLQHCEAQGEPLWDAEEKEIAAEFLAHAHLIRQEKATALQENRPPQITALVQKWGGATIFYRRTLPESPSYRLNEGEVSIALAEGIFWKDALTPLAILTDTYGHARALGFAETALEFPCRSVFMATGTTPNTILAAEEASFRLDGETFQAVDFSGFPVTPEKSAKPQQVHVQAFRSLKTDQSVTFFGDLHPSYRGSVVKAMASAKYGAPVVNQLLKKKPPAALRFSSLRKQLNAGFRSVVQAVTALTPSVWEIRIKSPQAAKQFRPGQFFRFQGFTTGASSAMEGLALTGVDVSPEEGLVSLIVLDAGASSHMCQFLQPGDVVSLMGPTGTPTTIPSGETVLLVGGGLGNAVLFSISSALRENGCRVLSVAGYKTPQDVFKREKVEEGCDQLIWCCESGEITPTRAQDFFVKGQVVDALHFYAKQKNALIPLQNIDRLMVIGPSPMMAAVAVARDQPGLKDVLNPNHIALGSLNSPMQCMMKEICGQCLQPILDPETGLTQLVYACHTQDHSLDRVDFSCLTQRLRQNSVLEKVKSN